MGKCAIIRFAAGAAFVFAASETLPAAELTHRWSFNGDYSDSVGGADAVKCGTYVSLYGGRVHMGYGACSHGTGYVDLGTNMLDTTAATLEIPKAELPPGKMLKIAARPLSSLGTFGKPIITDFKV